MTFAVVLLAAGIVTMFVHPRRVPLWAGPTVFALIGLATQTIAWSTARSALDVLRDPLLFLVFAVPLAVLLDRIGVFAALAARVDEGRHLLLWLWLLGIGVTIVFNLDAAVVLLTPLYVRIAHRHNIPPVVLAFQPALLACLASNPLPVSNLTNLIVAEQHDLGLGEFLVHLGPVTVVACTVGWFGYRRWAGGVIDGTGWARDVPPYPAHVAPNSAGWARDEQPGAQIAPTRTDRAQPELDDGEVADAGRALRRGLPIVGFVLVGFTVGNIIGVPAWVVAAIAVAAAVALTRDVPWRTIPSGAMLVAASLAVLVAGALEDLHVDRLLDAGGMLGRLRAFGFGAIASDVTNNLPTVLAGSASLHDRSQVWALLTGTNIGPVLVLTGALSGLLWRDTAKRLGVGVTAREYTTVGVRIGLLALLLAGATVVVLG